VGSSLANYYRFYVDGDDTHPYGGWKCNPINPTVTASLAQGTPSGTNQYFGVAYNVDNAVSKGNPAALGAIRFGRCYLLCTGGESGNYATFAGAGIFNDYNDGTNGWNRLGLLQPDGASFKMQGLFQMGSSGATVDFRDSNKTLNIQATPFVTASFNTFEVQNSGSRVDWTGITINALGTVSRGRFLATGNADINFENCTFNDMDAFTFQSNSTVNLTVFRRCGLVTVGAGTLTNCTFDQPSGAIGCSTSALSYLSDCIFVSDGTGHAVDLGTISATTSMTWDCVDSGYGSTGTANATIKVSVASGQTLTINVGAGKSTPTYYNTGSGSVSVVSGQVTLTLSGLISGSDVVIKTSDTNTALVNVDQNSGSTYGYIYTYAASTYVDISIMKAGYMPLTIYDFLLADSNATLPIAQVIDRAYT